MDGPARARARRAPRAGLAAGLAVVVAGVALTTWSVTAARSSPGWPPRPVDAAAHPLGQPTIVPPTGGSFRFLATQQGSSAPVAYDPCRPVHVVVRHHGEPAEADALVEDALVEIGRVTGLQFRVDGDTAEPPSPRRGVVDRARYGDRWSPVLVAWSDPAETPSLAGAVLARAGSSSVTTDGPGTRRYVTGQVVLDTPDIASLLREARGRVRVRAVVLHELGHLVGLDHVDDPGELMYPQAYPDKVFLGPGDLRGLAALGSGRCFTDH